jgi:hypothetical protein
VIWKPTLHSTTQLNNRGNMIGNPLRAADKAADIKAYRQEKMDMVCQAITTSDVGLKRICEAFKKDDPTFPAKRTIREWMEDDADFAAQYSRAKEIQADHIFDEIIEIADTPQLGEIRTEKANGDIVCRHARA